MSIQAIEAGFAIPPPSFSAEAIEGALAMGRAYPASFRERELGLMQLRNPPLVEFYEGQIKELAESDPQQIEPWRMHYAAGHAILRVVVERAMPLPARTIEQLRSYAYFMKTSPEEFADQFEEDYRAHPAVQGTLKRFADNNNENAVGAYVMLGAHGSVANPGRAPRHYPLAPAAPQAPVKRSSSSPEQRRKTKAYAVNKRFGK